VVDDFPLFRRGVGDLLVEGFHGVKIGEAGNAHEMLDFAEAGSRGTWAVMDISMPGMKRLGRDQTSENGSSPICRC